MKVFKFAFVLFCLLAYTWAFCRPLQGQTFQPLNAWHPAVTTATENLPFRAFVEKASPIFADRRMTLKIAEIPAGDQVTVLEKFESSRDSQFVVLLASYTDKRGKEIVGWLSGTLHVTVPR